MRKTLVFLTVFCLSSLLLFALAGCAPAPTVAPTAVPSNTPQPSATQIPEPTPTLPPPTPTPNPHPEIIDTFEKTVLSEGMAGKADIGYVTWSDGSPVSITLALLTGEQALPGQADDNSVLLLESDIRGGGWGGFSHAFTDPSVTEWIPQDWSAFTGISLWIWGNNTGSTLFVDILENRKTGSTSDDAERWSYFFKDDFSGWKYLEIPFSEFTRKDIGNGAPNDGLALTEVHGYAIGILRMDYLGVVINYVDDVKLFGSAP